MSFLNRLLKRQSQGAASSISSHTSPYASDELFDADLQKQRHEKALASGATLDQAASALIRGDSSLALSLACAALESVPDDHTRVAEEVRARARETISRIPNIHLQGDVWWKEAGEALDNLFTGIELMSTMKAPSPSESRAWEKLQQYIERQKEVSQSIWDNAEYAFKRFEYLQAIWPQQWQALVELREGVMDYMRGVGFLKILLDLKSKSSKPLDQGTTDRLLGCFTEFTDSGRQHIEKGFSLFAPP